MVLVQALIKSKLHSKELFGMTRLSIKMLSTLPKTLGFAAQESSHNRLNETYCRNSLQPSKGSQKGRGVKGDGLMCEESARSLMQLGVTPCRLDQPLVSNGHLASSPCVRA